MTIAEYSLGPPMRPPIHHDNGFLDKLPARSPTASDYRTLGSWIGLLEAGEAGQGVPFLPHNDIPDGLAAYRHFLFGNGMDRQFSYERYIANDPSGSITLENAIADAQEGALWLYLENYGSGDALFYMTGSAIPVGSGDKKFSVRFPYPLTENWQKAIGFHVIWISASVVAKSSGNDILFTMDFTLHAEDRFNFNPGATDIATGIPDSANGIFEVTGLAHQYMNYSILKRKVSWQNDVTSSPNAAESVSRSRDRQPQDNRRIRNRR